MDITHLFVCGGDFVFPEEPATIGAEFYNFVSMTQIAAG
jgi:hypothetical protein